jgi:hypothetical protein
MAENSLLVAIEEFLRTSEMPDTTFGRRAMGDPHFVRDLRRGRRIFNETEAKVRGFMEACEAEKAEPAPDKQEAA